MRPSGVRQATDQVEMPRIITPSSTAWPPIGASRTAMTRPSASLTLEPVSAAPFAVVGVSVGSALMGTPGSLPDAPMVNGPAKQVLNLARALALGRPALEALHAATGVDKLLLAGVEG